MQVGEQIVDVLRVHIGLRRHQAVAMQNGVGYALIVGWSATVQLLFLEDAAQRRPVQQVVGAVIVALRAVRLKDDMALRLLRVELV
jgi:hypothetical protein